MGSVRSFGFCTRIRTFSRCSHRSLLSSSTFTIASVGACNFGTNSAQPPSITASRNGTERLRLRMRPIVTNRTAGAADPVAAFACVGGGGVQRFGATNVAPQLRPYILLSIA